MALHEQATAPRDAEALWQRIGELIGKAEGYGPAAETRRVTIVLSDLRGFTAISEKFSVMDIKQ